MTSLDREKYLLPTPLINCRHRSILAYVQSHIRNTKDPVARAVRLYYAVRDEVAYEFLFPHAPKYYKASNILKRRKGFCISKATLLCAAARAAGIPARVCFADVRNHLATEKTIEYVGSDVFVFHGITELFLTGKWVKATPAFNREFCRNFNVPPLEFNGYDDSIFQAYDMKSNRFMEYVSFRGCFDDVPVEEIVHAWVDFYGEQRVKIWIEDVERVMAGAT
jgi:transglutaminase-like putative cysteine protease